jgi:hypothetical protein
LKELAINGFDILVQLLNEIAALQFGDIVFGSDIKEDKRSLDEEVYIEIEVAVAIDFIHHFSERGSSGGSTGASPVPEPRNHFAPLPALQWVNYRLTWL